jgi:hypothetical protein
MQIIDPTQGGYEAQLSVEVGTGGMRSGERICMLSNGKPNARALLVGIGSRLGWPDTVPVFTKPTSARPADADLLDRIARDFDIALVAIGD